MTMCRGLCAPRHTHTHQHTRPHTHTHTHTHTARLAAPFGQVDLCSNMCAFGFQSRSAYRHPGLPAHAQVPGRCKQECIMRTVADRAVARTHARDRTVFEGDGSTHAVAGVLTCALYVRWMGGACSHDMKRMHGRPLNFGLRRP